MKKILLESPNQRLKIDCYEIINSYQEAIAEAFLHFLQADGDAIHSKIGLVESLEAKMYPSQEMIENVYVVMEKFMQNILDSLNNDLKTKFEKYNRVHIPISFDDLISKEHYRSRQEKIAKRLDLLIQTGNIPAIITTISILFIPNIYLPAALTITLVTHIVALLSKINVMSQETKSKLTNDIIQWQQEQNIEFANHSSKLWILALKKKVLSQTTNQINQKNKKDIVFDKIMVIIDNVIKAKEYPFNIVRRLRKK